MRLALGVEAPPVPKAPRSVRTTPPRPARPDREDSAAWLAVRLSLAGDRRTLDRLWYWLSFHAARLDKRESRRAKVRGIDGEPRFCVSELAALVLDAELHPDLFAADPDLYAATIGVTGAAGV